MVAGAEPVVKHHHAKLVPVHVQPLHQRHTRRNTRGTLERDRDGRVCCGNGGHVALERAECDAPVWCVAGRGQGLRPLRKSAVLGRPLQKQHRHCMLSLGGIGESGRCDEILID